MDVDRPFRTAFAALLRRSQGHSASRDLINAFIRELGINEPDGVAHTILDEFLVPGSDGSEVEQSFRPIAIAFDGTKLYVRFPRPFAQIAIL